MKSWTELQAKLFLGLLQDEYYGSALLLDLATGLRRGELLGLRRIDVDLEHGRVRVRQQLTGVKGQLHIGPPKSRSGSRDL